ncbi:MAG TPA: hypothetical protein VKK79_16775 [Candidatus Lokiarchaeia archaeon]|nr:hypothetical protein [Candidatus Lokiarchaeia archaeon]
MGVRAFAIKVVTSDASILLDPSCALGPVPHFPNPHPFEYWALQDANRRILEAAAGTEIAIISHFHQDHYKPPLTNWIYNGSSRAIFNQIFQGRLIYAKDPAVSMGSNQRNRARELQRALRQVKGTLVSCDAQCFEWGGTALQFSPPLPHGARGSPQGWVIATCISEGEDRFCVCPDVQGPTENVTLQWIVDQAPTELAIGGPPLYLPASKFSEQQRAAFFQNLDLLSKICKKIVLDHHIFRNTSGVHIFCQQQRELSNQQCLLCNFAEQGGARENFFEAQREMLYEKYPASVEFLNWVASPKTQRQRVPPPIPPELPNLTD